MNKEDHTSVQLEGKPWPQGGCKGRAGPWGVACSWFGCVQRDTSSSPRSVKIWHMDTWLPQVPPPCQKICRPYGRYASLPPKILALTSEVGDRQLTAKPVNFTGRTRRLTTLLDGLPGKLRQYMSLKAHGDLQDANIPQTRTTRHN
jgi:hypothetical protein